MKLVIFGATGGTGRALVEQALKQGHVVTAFARNPAKVLSASGNLKVVKGDILNFESVETAIEGQDAVLSALGVKPRVWLILIAALAAQVLARVLSLSGEFNLIVRIGVPVLAILIFTRRNRTLSNGTKNIVQAMEKRGVKIFVCESSLGIGDSRGQLGFLYSYVLAPLLLRGIFADKESQEAIIQSSTLDWVIVRPAALTNGPRRGTYRVGARVGHWFPTATISRADVADFMLKQLTEHAYLRKTPGIAY